MIVEETEATANHGLGIGRPGETDSWGEVIFFIEGRVVVPAQAPVDCQIACYLPVILNPEAVVVVAKMDFVGLRSKAADSKKKEKAGVDGAKLQIVSFGCK